MSLDWLIARPLAHRGLHDAGVGVVENTASAFSAAIAAGYGIECDVQVSRDGEAMVHHDDDLGRLTEGDAPLAHMMAAELRNVRFKTCADRMQSLGELCDLVAGRVALVVEIKRRFDGDMRLVRRVCETLKGYSGPAAAMSFDPDVVAAVRTFAPAVARGIVAERRYDHPEWSERSRADKGRMAFLLHAARTRPHFVAYAVQDLPSPAPLIARRLFGLPLLTWTVRTPEDRAVAARWADQMIFEGFRP
jgi:glycerophosphoryl diester phosphodiesterase